uniref:Uncharacterized protein n=1 Tax=Ectopseudomonas oleovorans TaxID=301 RepID=A0A653B543_ECTOL
MSAASQICSEDGISVLYFARLEPPVLPAREATRKLRRCTLNRLPRTITTPRSTTSSSPNCASRKRC